MERCATCRHYEVQEPPPPYRIVSEWDRAGPEYGLCRLTVSRDDETQTLAQAQDAENYEAWLKVRPNFGCVQWEARED